jgi:hypothetical protein
MHFGLLISLIAFLFHLCWSKSAFASSRRGGAAGRTRLLIDFLPSSAIELASIKHSLPHILKVLGTMKPKANQVRGCRSKESFRDFLGSHVIIHRMPDDDGKDSVIRVALTFVAVSPPHRVVCLPSRWLKLMLSTCCVSSVGKLSTFRWQRFIDRCRELWHNWIQNRLPRGHNSRSHIHVVHLTLNVKLNVARFN